MKNRRYARLLVILLAAVAAPLPLLAQDAAERVDRLVPSTDEVTVAVGSEVPFTVTAVDASGSSVDAPIRIIGPRNAVAVGDGTVRGLAQGSYEIVATLVVGPGATPVTVTVPVTVDWPAIDRVIVEVSGSALFVGTTRPHPVRALHADGTHRPDPAVVWQSSDPAIASVDPFGNVTGIAPGTVTIRAAFGGRETSLEFDVAALPAVSVELHDAPTEARTGDVIHFQATVRDASGAARDDIPVSWSHSYTATEGMLGVPAPGQMNDRGAYVADVPGIHTVVATVGSQSARHAFRALPRDAVQELEVVGHGAEDWYRTTDLWALEGMDGRDYVITGSKVSGGFAFFYDVTNPAAITKIDSIQVDARIVNDVKASPDGRYAVLSREGATNRRNGLVIVDMSTPSDPVVASVYEDGITGGVHNVFATDDYLYALSDGDKYVIIDMTDIYAPRYVSEYNHPNSRVHDVWVNDGIAYSSEWGTGVVVVDVGNGRWGGSPENPVFVTAFPTPSGATHAAFPYFSESTGKTYLFLGDEIMTRTGLAWAGYPRSMGSYAQRYDPETGTGGIPLVTRGYIQIVDFTDPENPEMVARYEVPEFGTHNMWVEDDKLYQAYYEGGLRVVDVSGELMGNLYTQGREIAVFKSASPAGYTPNATMVWGAQPFKGHVFFSDTNSGLWSVKLQPKGRPIS
ncbi:MAG: Ig-like domain-containing protein [Gemmatimonadota bacterium]